MTNDTNNALLARKRGTSLGHALPEEMTRVRKLIPLYQELPNNVGAFAIHCMHSSLDQAQEALAEGDVIAMLRAYEDLKGYSA